MPIKAENRKRYPKNWLTEIRPAILDRARNKCERCGVRNYAVGYRLSEKYARAFCHATEREFKTHAEAAKWRGDNDLIIIVLTIAHLDHRPENNIPDNLKALCHRCHNRHDARYRAVNRQMSLLRNQTTLT